MNNILSVNENKCTSCQVCAAVCPVEAIKIDFDENGFYRPEIDGEKCISCGKCKKVCYKFDDSISMSDECRAVYACKSEEDILNDVTSGGVAYLLAKAAISEGYKVAGVVYDAERNIAAAEITDTDAECFKGSKYIQAYTAEAFKEIVADNTTTKYMVFGLPCHIYALRKAAKINKTESKFIFVDLFCHGCPSMLLWNKTIKKAKEILKVDKFEKVEFRSKKKGWHEFCLNFETLDERSLTWGEFSAFYRLFFSNLVLNDACRDCKLRSTMAYTDIRLGDFWGWQYDEDVTGVSAVSVASEKGYEWLKKLPKHIFVAEHSMQEVVNSQSYGKVYNVDTKRRNMLFELLRSNAEIDTIHKSYEKSLSAKAKIKKCIKRALALMPQSFGNLVKKSFHHRV